MPALRDSMSSAPLTSMTTPAAGVSGRSSNGTCGEAHAAGLQTLCNRSSRPEPIGLPPLTRATRPPDPLKPDRAATLGHGRPARVRPWWRPRRCPRHRLCFLSQRPFGRGLAVVCGIPIPLPRRLRAPWARGRDAGALPVRGRREVACAGGVGGPGQGCTAGLGQAPWCVRAPRWRRCGGRLPSGR